MNKITIKFKKSHEDKNYPIIIDRGVSRNIGSYVDLNRRVFLLTDDGVPPKLVEQVASQCKEVHIHTVAAGEGAKCFGVLENALKALLENHFTRDDLVIALGGGVIGDLAGFVASSYMRGMPFINIPTTTLSQIDSCIGGKVGINFLGVKNIVGAFYQPKAVLVDADTLDTLPKRHFNNGLVEALKAGLIRDGALFELLEKDDFYKHMDEIILRALRVKRTVIMRDEEEKGLRKILNFGHTIGHGVEAACGLLELYHGECVGIGMLPMIEDVDLRARTEKVLKTLQIPLHIEYDKQRAYEFAQSDKKAHGSSITVVKVRKLGKAILTDISLDELKEYMV